MTATDDAHEQSEPAGLSDALLHILRQSPGTQHKVSELADATGLPARTVGTALANYSRRRAEGRRSEWRHVRRVSHGWYVYDPEPTTGSSNDDTDTWQVLGRDEQVVVLRSPEGTLYAARPITP